MFFKNLKKQGEMVSVKHSLLRVFFILSVLGFVGVGLGLLYEYSGSDLSSGIFNNSLYNGSGQYVHLNWTDDTNTSYVEQGNYTSSVIDLGAETGFAEMKWQGKGSCLENMSYIDKLGGYCIDQYEVSKPDATESSAGSDTSMATSKPNVLPWASINQLSAKTACVNAGKHLCTSEEWLGAANIQGQVYYLPSDLMVAPYSCNTNSQCTPCKTGNSSGCVSEEGVYDMVGNLREWVDEVVDTVKPCNPGSKGYCYANSTGGWQTSADSNTDKYGDDGVYFLANTASGLAVMRGGLWDSGAAAGVFSALLNNAPSLSHSSVGFRCCSSTL